MLISSTNVKRHMYFEFVLFMKIWKYVIKKNCRHFRTASCDGLKPSQISIFAGIMKKLTV